MDLVKDGAAVQGAPDDMNLRRDLNTQTKFVNESVSTLIYINYITCVQLDIYINFSVFIISRFLCFN